MFLVPEMTYAVPRLRPLLYDPLPPDVKPHVAVMDRYWLTAEAASVYTRAAAVLSFEMHSPIIAVANGTPAASNTPWSDCIVQSSTNPPRVFGRSCPKRIVAGDRCCTSRMIGSSDGFWKVPAA